MKKLLVLVLALCLVCGLAACGEKEAPSFDIADLQHKSGVITEALISGDYTAVTAYFDAAMSKALTAESLGQTWEMITGPIGAYQETSWGDEGPLQQYYQLRPLLTYEGNIVQLALTWNEDGQLAGLHTSLRGNIKPVEGGEADPNAPYTEEDIYIGSYQLAGKLTLPKGVEQPPVVILIHGSGASDMDETIYGNKPFADIAHGLAERGIASLRYDKRTFAHPELFADAASLTIEHETLLDADAAIERMLNDERLGDVYVLGHSLGGMLVPYIAAQHQELSGVIALAGSLRSLAEISYDQNVDVVEALWDTLPADQQQLLTQQLAVLAQQRDAAMALTADDGQQYIGIPAAYWVSLNQVDGSAYLAQMNMPLLVLQGSADFQVYADVDYPLWQQELDAAQVSRYEMHLFEGLNHLFMKAKGYADTTEYMELDHVDAAVISTIADWVLDAEK